MHGSTPPRDVIKGAKLLPLILCLLVSVVPISSRQVRKEPGSSVRVIRGIVVANDADSTRVRGARIVVSFADGSTTSALSDESGQFEFDAPSNMSGTVTATKAGFAPTTAALPLGASTGVRLVLDQGAAISGRIVDQIGAPIAGMRVQVQRVDPPIAGNGTVEGAETNDLGEFRIGGLSAGGYRLAIDSMSTFAPVFRLVVRPPESKPDTDRVVERSLQLGRGEQRWMDISYDDFRIDLVGGAAEHARRLTTFEGTGADRVSTRAASIQGRILSPDGLPIAGAVVQALPIPPNGTDGQQRRRYASSDIDGRYVVRGLTARDWKITAARPGFIDTSYGQRRSTDWGELVHVDAGDRLQGIDVTFLRGGIVSGTVVDRFGEPLEGLTVRLLQNLGGVASLSNKVAGQRTDDRGQYRLFNIPPGSYYVVVSDNPAGGGSMSPSAPQVFYPGSDTLADAVPVRVDLGTTLFGISLPFVPGRLSRVFGNAIASDGQAFHGEVTLTVTARSRVPAPPARKASVKNGVFEFTGVPQGEYVVHAIDSSFEEFGMAFVTVNEATVGPIAVRTLPGMSIRGRITLEDSNGLAIPAGIGLLAVSTDRDYAPSLGFVPRAQIDTDDTFEMDGLAGFRRLTLTGVPEGWWIKSAIVDGIDASTTPVRFVPGAPPLENIEIVLSNKSASIVGEVTNVQPAQRSAVGILVFPTDSNRWHGPFIGNAGLDQDGHFKVLGIPPGDYWVVATTTAEIEGDFQNNLAALLASLVPSAKRATLREGAPVSVQLTIRERAQ
ncbi:MAG TPA: carboxypeptidase-like regulatory domain-containing protein [Vicinamibacterales bacterium]|nr:carboxypeptidase-like regulatory domain-containing protein [Vicinamibacterales bacterium]